AAREQLGIAGDEDVVQTLASLPTAAQRVEHAHHLRSQQLRRAGVLDDEVGRLDLLVRWKLGADAGTRFALGEPVAQAQAADLLLDRGGDDDEAVEAVLQR